MLGTYIIFIKLFNLICIKMFKTRKTLAGYFCHRRFSHSSPYVRFFNLNAKKKHPHNEVAAERSLLKIS